MKGSSGGVIPVNTATNKPGPAIHAGGVIAIAITPNGKTAYVANGATVIPINTATDKRPPWPRRS